MKLKILIHRVNIIKDILYYSWNNPHSIWVMKLPLIRKGNEKTFILNPTAQSIWRQNKKSDKLALKCWWVNALLFYLQRKLLTIHLVPALARIKKNSLKNLTQNNEKSTMNNTVFSILLLIAE